MRRENFPSSRLCLIRRRRIQLLQALKDARCKAAFRSSCFQLCFSWTRRRHPIKTSDILIINFFLESFWLRFYETLNLIRKIWGKNVFFIFFPLSLIWLNIFHSLRNRDEGDSGEIEEDDGYHISLFAWLLSGLPSLKGIITDKEFNYYSSCLAV